MREMNDLTVPVVPVAAIRHETLTLHLEIFKRSPPEFGRYDLSDSATVVHKRHTSGCHGLKRCDAEVLIFGGVDIDLAGF
jgi:hypothetical protein